MPAFRLMLIFADAFDALFLRRYATIRHDYDFFRLYAAAMLPYLFR